VEGYAPSVGAEHWEGVRAVSFEAGRARVTVTAGWEAVAARLRMLGAEVTSVRQMSLREIYLLITGTD
jgi:hypothetical protein